MKRSGRRSNIAAALFFLLAAPYGPQLGAQRGSATEAAAHSKAEVRFDFARVGLPVPKFTLDVKEDGSGTYAGEQTLPGTPQRIQREFVLSATTTRKIFALARAAHFSPEVCASKVRNIANTGEKQFTYAASGELSSCTYNYSDNKEVEALTEMFQGIALTLDMGRRLDFLHRFDRLGLNEAMTSLTDEASAGRALEIGTIATSLRSIASDAEVMQRVRTQANALLARIPADLREPAF